MLQRRQLLRAAAVLPATSLLGLGSARAGKSFATKTVKIVVAGPPSGTSDLLARLLAAGLPDLLDQPAVVENKPGAGGIIGTKYVVDSAADGHTLLLGHTATNAIVPSLYHPKPYDAVADFTPIAPMGTAPDLLVVPASSPAHSVPELLAMGRKNGLTYGSAGVGLPQHFFGFMLSKDSGVPMRHVPYRGSAPALMDVMSGQVDMMFVTSGAAAPYVRDGRLRALATATAQRSPFFPQVPCMRELGYPGIAHVTWFGIFAPAHTPPAVADELNAAVTTIMGRPAVRTRLESLFVEPAPAQKRDAFAAFVQGDAADWAEIVRKSGITPE